MRAPFVFQAEAVGMLFLLWHQEYKVMGKTVEVEIDQTGQVWDPPRCPWAVYDTKTKMKRTLQSLDEFTVAGVNLAAYWPDDPSENITKGQLMEEPFELWDSLSLANVVTGNEGFWDLIRYRQLLRRPVNSFYYDKVALKRWFPTVGIATPRSFAIQYASELTASGELKDEAKAILSLLPDQADYAAKPSHMSLSNGTCLVSYDVASNVTSYSSKAFSFKEEEKFNPELVAWHLAKHLHYKATDWESWTLQNVKPGIIIEERFSDLTCLNCPPPEFRVFIIWGRVWIVTVETVEDENKWVRGFFNRNGTMVPTRHDYGQNPLETDLDWVDFSRVIEIGEHLGAHKDLLRVDVFVGVRGSSSAVTKEDRLAEVEYVVSELSFHPTTVFDDVEISDEGARLWIAGYKMGNYHVVPNAEVPKVFAETGLLPLDAALSMA